MTLDELWMKYHKMLNTSLRFGQFYCNEKGINNPELFYCEDNNLAYQIIRERYKPDWGVNAERFQLGYSKYQPPLKTNYNPPTNEENNE